MAVRHGYGKIAGTDALVFAYDTGDTRNSYRGEPTTNLITHVLPNSNWNTNGSGVIITQNYGYDHNGVLRSSKIMDNPNSGNASFAYTSAFNVSAGTYTFSAMVKTSSANASNNSSMVLYNMNPITNLGETSFTSITPGVWTKVSVTGTLASGTTHIAPHFFSLPGDGTNFIEVVDVQLEQKSHATPFAGALGTRSATQGLLDLTGNSSIDLSNVSFDSNAQKLFDGTNDYTLTQNLASHFSSTAVSQFITVYPISAGQVLTELGQSAINTTWHDVNIDLNSSGQFLFSIWHGSLGNRVTSPAKAFNQWYHVGFTYDETTLTGYINGQSVGTTSFSRVAPYNNGYGLYYAFGANDSTNMSSTAYFEGKISTAHIYNRALTADEVRNNYNQYRTRFNI